MSDVTQLLDSIKGGRQAASAELLPLVYDELRRLASVRMATEAGGHTLQPTALVHEAWIRLAKPGQGGWNNRAHFFRAAALAMRRILVERARAKACAIRGQRAEHVALDDSLLTAASPDQRVLLVNEAIDLLERDDPDSARIVTLKFFGGFTNREIAGMLDIAERTVERQWCYARASLLTLVRGADLPVSKA